MRGDLVLLNANDGSPVVQVAAGQCRKFDVAIENTKWNNARKLPLLRGHLELDCVIDGAELHGRLVYENCD